MLVYSLNQRQIRYFQNFLLSVYQRTTSKITFVRFTQLMSLTSTSTIATNNMWRYNSLDQSHVALDSRDDGAVSSRAPTHLRPQTPSASISDIWRNSDDEPITDRHHGNAHLWRSSGAQSGLCENLSWWLTDNKIQRQKHRRQYSAAPNSGACHTNITYLYW